MENFFSLSLTLINSFKLISQIRVTTIDDDDDGDAKSLSISIFFIVVN